MNFHARLNALERGVGDLIERGATDRDFAVFADEFIRADAAHKSLVLALSSRFGTRDLRELLPMLDPAIGPLRHAVGKFCNVHRYKFPGAKVIRVRRIQVFSCQSLVTRSGDGGFLQIFESDTAEFSAAASE